MKSLQAISAGLLSVAIVGMSADLATAQSKDKAAGKDSAATTEVSSTNSDDQPKSAVHKEDAKQSTYLGIIARPLHEGFLAHFRDEVEHRQGVVVKEVASGSPADKAGLKANDILMTYGDQKLYTPGQLMGLVRESKPDSKVQLGYERNSKHQDVSITLAQHALPLMRRSGKPVMDKHPTATSMDDQTQWSSFDSLTIKSLGDHRYQAQVSYLDNLGKVESLKFEGTRDEIRQDITSRSDLPQNERGHLLRALNMSGERIEFDAPRVFRTDDGRIIWEFSEPVFPFYEMEWNES